MCLTPELYMQVEISNLYMRRCKLSLDDFLALDKKYNILEFIKEGYEPFHLMGDDGILVEVQDYIESQRGTDVSE